LVALSESLQLRQLTSSSTVPHLVGDRPERVSSLKFQAKGEGGMEAYSRVCDYCAPCFVMLLAVTLMLAWMLSIRREK
jgi:hypothetical protein